MAKITEIRRTSIFDSSLQTLVNTVNCVGVMGRGLALEFKMRFPAMFSQYQQACRGGQLRPGMLMLYKASSPWILNFPTKDHWRLPSKLEYIAAGLEKFARTYHQKGITSVAFPRLGTTAGQLNWEDVRGLMYGALAPLKDLEVEIYHFEPNADDSLFERLYQKCHRLSVEDYVAVIGLPKRAARVVHTAFSERRVTSMLQLQALPGIGQKSLLALYACVDDAPRRIVTAAERQLTLF